jgi:hypothetical protein
MPTPARTRTGWAAPRGPFAQPPAPPRPDGLAGVYRRRDPTAERLAHSRAVTDQVLPPLPLRQWVLSRPKRIRPFLLHDPRLAGDVLRVLLRGIRTTLRRASSPAPHDAQLGCARILARIHEVFPLTCRAAEATCASSSSSPPPNLPTLSSPTSACPPPRRPSPRPADRPSPNSPLTPPPHRPPRPGFARDR